MNSKHKIQAGRHLAELLLDCGPAWGQCAQLASRLGVAPALVRKWRQRGYVSAEGAFIVGQRIGGKYTQGYMRPDLFDVPATADLRHVQV